MAQIIDVHPLGTGPDPKVRLRGLSSTAGRSEPWKRTRRHMIRLRRPRIAIALTGVVAAGAVFIAGSPASASAGPVVALGGPAEPAANRVSAPAPTQCDGLAKNSKQAEGCIDSNPLLGPSERPRSGRAGSVYGYIAKMTRRYNPFGSTTKAAFLDLYYNNGKWTPPPEGGFAIDPETMQPKHHIITLQPLKNGKPVFVDRFGRETGSFLAPAATSYARRAVPPQSLDTFGICATPSAPTCGAPYNYHLYRVMKAFRVDAGRIAPWFAQKGGGLQYITCVAADFQCPTDPNPKLPNVQELVSEGDLEPQVLPLQ